MFFFSFFFFASALASFFTGCDLKLHLKKHMFGNSVSHFDVKACRCSTLVVCELPSAFVVQFFRSANWSLLYLVYPNGLRTKLKGFKVQERNRRTYISSCSDVIIPLCFIRYLLYTNVWFSLAKMAALLIEKFSGKLH